MPDLDIVIVHYHAAALVRDAVEALQRDARASGLTIGVFVVDNGSTGEERALLQSLPLTYLPTGRDAGYAGGVNFAFPATRADSLIVMNEDVMVLPGCLGALRAALQGGAAVAGPLFYWDRDRRFLLPCTEERSRGNELAKAGARRSLEKLARARGRWRRHARRHWRATRPMPTTALSGALLAFRRDTWPAVGAWDESYQLYFDENDWLSRVKRAGLQSLYVPAAEAVHLHNPGLAQEPDREKWQAESFLRFGNRTYGEHFMRRLLRLATRPPVIPEWEPLAVDAGVSLDIPAGAAWPLWVELTLTPLGFPAAAARLTDRSARRWHFEGMKGLEFLRGRFYLQLVDDEGREIRRGSFDMAAVTASEGAPMEDALR